MTRQVGFGTPSGTGYYNETGFRQVGVPIGYYNETSMPFAGLAQDAPRIVPRSTAFYAQDWVQGSARLLAATSPFFGAVNDPIAFRVSGSVARQAQDWVTANTDIPVESALPVGMQFFEIPRPPLFQFNSQDLVGQSPQPPPPDVPGIEYQMFARHRGRR